MKTNSILRVLFVLAAFSLPFVYVAYLWPTLPERVPIHFGADGQPDRFGPRGQVLLAPGILMTVGLGAYLLLRNLRRIDPKQNAGGETVFKLADGLLVFLSLLAVYIVHSAKAGETDNVLFVIVGLLFAWIGNVMHSLKPNYFAGFRFPWTLESEHNWRKTHRFGGKLWFFGGLAMAASMWVLPLSNGLAVFFGIVAVLCVAPVVYSYRLFRKTGKTDSGLGMQN